MAKTTITEALAEIKTINKRLEKKRLSIMPYIARDLRVKDPFEAKGGSESFIRSERQGITDLQTRIVQIRTAIQRANLDTSFTVDGHTKNVSEWLTWRREVSDGERNFLTALNNGLKQFRQDLLKKGGQVRSAASVPESFDASAPPEMVINIDEKHLLEQLETVEKVLGELDGKLSLLNATTFIEV